MTSLRPLNGAIQPGAAVRGAWMLQNGYPAPTVTLVLTQVYALATDQSPSVIAATECRPCIHHGQPQAFKRRNSAGVQRCGGRGCAERLPSPTGTRVLNRDYAPATDQSPPAIAANESRPCTHHDQPQAFKRRNSAGCSSAGGVDVAEWLPSPHSNPRLDSSLRARNGSEPLGDCGN